MKESPDAIQLFMDTLDRMELEAAEVGLTLRQLCNEAGVSRNTVTRWRRQAPETIRVLRRMQVAVRDYEPVPKVRRVKANHSAIVAQKGSTPRQLIDATARTILRRMLVSQRSSPLWEELFGYGVDELRDHFSRQFHSGMGWDNVETWHADHILPLASFSYERAEGAEFKAAWALTNLRPLLKRENMRKGAKRLHLI